MAWRWILPALAVKLALNLAVADRYGWHRDELYFFEAGDHPAAGYVDFPPVMPLLAGLARALFGGSLVGLRLLAILAGLGVIVVSCLICRRLGGERAAQAITAFSLAFAPFLLGSNGLFQTVSFDQLGWALVVLAVLGVAEGPAPTWRWVALGAAVGVALMTKYTAAVLIAGLIVGYALANPHVRVDRRLGWAALVAAAIVLPNLVWNAGHGWTAFDFVVDPPPSASDESRVEFVTNLLLYPGPVGLALAAAGILRLSRDRSRRPLAVAAAFVLVLLLTGGGKSYYAMPLLALLVPAGAVTVEHLARVHGRWIAPAVAAVAALAILPALPLVLPVRGERELASSGLWKDRTDYADQIGWEELTADTARAWRTLPAERRRGAAILAGNYGVAGAIDRFGSAQGLPAARSTHLTYRYWGPGDDAGARTVVIVGFDDAALPRLCRRHRVVARASNRLGIRNREWGRPIATCRLRDSLGRLWDELD